MDPITSTSKAAKWQNFQATEDWEIASPHFEEIFGPSNSSAMTPEEKKSEIWYTFYNLPHDTDLKQALGKNSLVQTRKKACLRSVTQALVTTWNVFTRIQ